MRWHRYGSVLYADNEGSRFEITRGSGELSGYYLTERQGLFGEQISLGRFNSLEEAKNAAMKIHRPNVDAAKGGTRKRRANPANKKIRKAIAYAYPSSTNAQKLGVSRTGGYYVERSIMREDGTWSPPYIAPDGGQEAFQKIDDPELLAIFRGADGVVSPYSMNRRRKLNPGRNAVHTSKWDSCVRKVKAKGSAYDPYAVCTAALGERGAIRSSHRRKNANGQFIVAAKIGSKYYFLTPDRMMSSNEATARRYRSFAHARNHAKKLATEIPNASVSVNKP